jgi:hypothetical protein
MKKRRNSMVETQKTISEWAVKIFGYPTRQRAVDRMMEEVEELNKLDVNSYTTFNEISDECADIYITMCQVADTFGFDLHACIDHKMQINRARKWKIAGDGTGQHVKE